MNERWAENHRLTTEHRSGDHGLPGTPCEHYCEFAGEVTHSPIAVDKDGNGPVDEWGDDYDRTICWCGREGCTRYLCGAIFPGRPGQDPCRKPARHATEAPDTDWKRDYHSNGLLKWRVDGADLPKDADSAR